MSKQQRPDGPLDGARQVPRREALKGLGVLAVGAPTLAAIGCGGEPIALGTMLGSAGSEAAPASAAVGGSGVGGASSPRGAAGTGTSGVTAGSKASGGAPGAPAAGSAGAAHAGSGAAGASPGGAGATANTAGTPAAAGSGGNGLLPAFADAASCSLTTTDIEGPFFIDDHEFPDDESLIRSDVREGMSGCQFRLYFRLMDAKNKCAPISGAELYIWHCNADGYYSGFDGQDPTKPYMGAADPTPTNKDRFCRGVQTSDADGIASFVTIYPGWYAGRPIHLHLVARFDGKANRLITTQLYFPAAFTKEVHTSEPAYMARAAAIPAGSANPPAASTKPAIPTLKHTSGLVTGTLNVIVNKG